jgi:hypothetical protein
MRDELMAETMNKSFKIRRYGYSLRDDIGVIAPLFLDALRLYSNTVN